MAIHHHHDEAVRTTTSTSDDARNAAATMWVAVAAVIGVMFLVWLLMFSGAFRTRSQITTPGDDRAPVQQPRSQTEPRTSPVPLPSLQP